MKRAYIDEIHCKGCASELKHLFESIYGLSNITVCVEEDYVSYDGFVSERVIQEALANTKFKLIKVVKEKK